MLIIVFSLPHARTCKTDPFCTGTNTAPKALWRLRGSTAVLALRAAPARLVRTGRGCGTLVPLSAARTELAGPCAAGTGGPWPLDVAGAVRMALPARSAAPARAGPRAPLRSAPHGPAPQESHTAPACPAGTGSRGKPRSPRAGKAFCGPGRGWLCWR